MGSVIRLFDSDRQNPPRRAPRTRGVVEICYRYPAHQEIAEVSCGPDRREPAPKRSRERRRAS